MGRWMPVIPGKLQKRLVVQNPRKRVRVDGEWTWVPISKDFQQLTPRAKAVYLVLAAHAHRTEEWCVLRQSTISEESGVGLRSLQQALSELRVSGFVEVVLRPRRSSIYRLTDSAAANRYWGSGGGKGLFGGKMARDLVTNGEIRED